MARRNESQLLRPRRWTSDELVADLKKSADEFRRERLEEPLEEYSETFEQARDAIEEFLEETIDLSLLDTSASSILTDPSKLKSFRYLAGPPISYDDLKTLADTTSLSPAILRKDPDLVNRLVQTIRSGLDRNRFPWVSEQREPTSEEKYAAIIASAALVAAQRMATSRRNESKRAQEDRVRHALRVMGLQEFAVQGGSIPTLLKAPPPGFFCPNETTLGVRKADILVRLWDGRAVPIECKVSNSSTNSIKRLNNAAAAKAEGWIRDFGLTQVVPVADLSGVYKLRNLEDAQARGLTLYWAHRLDDLTNWIASTQS